LGFCGASDRLRVAYVGPHHGEEPPITGRNGSGTIFFTGCSLRCTYCQNGRISRDGLGQTLSLQELHRKVAGMIRKDRVHNINLVTPDHFFPYAFRLVSLCREDGFDLPVVWNVSGYQSIAMLRDAEEVADIYLPDFKYADATMAATLSSCRDYPQVALEAIVEMVKQKGFVNPNGDRDTPAQKGVLVRHLILPGAVENSTNALTTLFLEFGRRLPLSLMSQYTPVRRLRDPTLNRPITRGEFDRVYEHALELGFEHLYVQFPERRPPNPTKGAPFLPDFNRPRPFAQ
jgi:putative pyruvate formate lyase activating enzyme